MLLAIALSLVAAAAPHQLGHGAWSWFADPRVFFSPHSGHHLPAPPPPIALEPC